MMTLEFKESLWSPTEPSTDLSLIPSAVLLVNFFLAPVRFRVDGVDLLSWPEAGTDGWEDEPILGLAVKLPKRLAEAQSGERVEMFLNESGHLTFIRDVDRVRISSMGTRRSVVVDPVEFKGAISLFRERTRTAIMRHNDSICRHPEWADWFA